MTTRRHGFPLLVVACAAALVATACTMPGGWQQTSSAAAEREAAGATPESSGRMTSAQPSQAADGQSEGGAVRHYSARLEDLEPVEKPRPARLRITSLGIDAPIRPVGVAANGEMEVPTDAATVAWYEHGPSPGQRGSAVLAAHVDYDGRQGVFFRLADLRSGATITVDFEGAPARTFTVVDGASIAKSALPAKRLFRREGRPVLTLITCGGDFDPSTRSYSNNVIVAARPAAAAAG